MNVLRRLGLLVFETAWFALLAPFLVIAAPFSFRARRAARAAIGLFGAGVLRPRPKVAARAVQASVVTGAHGLDLAVADRVDFNVTNYELAVIGQIAAACPRRRVFEFGTFTGRTTLQLARQAPEADIFTIDLTDRAAPEAQNHPRITRYLGDSTAFDEVAFVSEHGLVDVVFIDGGHDYDVASSDTGKSLAMLSPGGVAVWHDYSRFEGVQRAVDERELNEVVQVAGTTLAVWFSGPS